MFGPMRMRVAAGVAATFPLLFALAANALSIIGGDGTLYQIDYTDMIALSLTGGLLGVIACSTTIASVSHRHNVFQSYAVTGFPRDLMFVGRVLASWIVAVSIGTLGLASGVLAHLATYDTSAAMRGQNYEATIRHLTIAAVASDAVTVFVLLMLASAAIVGLVTLTRSVGGAAAIVLVYAIAEGTILIALERAWEKDATLMSVAHASTVPAHFHLPPWSVLNAIDDITRTPFHSAWNSAVVVLSAWALFACTAGMLRLVRGDT